MQKKIAIGQWEQLKDRQPVHALVRNTDLMVETMLQWDVNRVFGLVGGYGAGLEICGVK